MLKVDKLAVSYGQSQVLYDLSLEVAAGEFVTIIGANGAGKTTLLKTLMGLIRPAAGTIWFQGRDITALPPWRRAELKIGYVPEGRRVFPDLTVAENLRLGGWRQNPTALKAQMAIAYELFPRLAERRDQQAKTMSGGEQQMLAIARALMLAPALLLVDEISMGLMPLLVSRSFQVLAELNRQGTTILLVEQNANKALKVAQRGYVLETGRIVLAGPAEQLRNNQAVKKAYLGG
jgi:branched-chain amino acid transport system ATP-binding protein